MHTYSRLKGLEIELFAHSIKALIPTCLSFACLLCYVMVCGLHVEVYDQESHIISIFNAIFNVIVLSGWWHLMMGGSIFWLRQNMLLWHFLTSWKMPSASFNWRHVLTLTTSHSQLIFEDYLQLIGTKQIVQKVKNSYGFHRPGWSYLWDCFVNLSCSRCVHIVCVV